MSRGARETDTAPTTSERPQIGPVRPARAPRVSEEALAGGLHGLAVRRAAVPLVELRLVAPLGPDQLARPAPPVVLGESMLSGTRAHDRSGLATALERIGASLRASVSGDLLVLSGSCLAPSLASLLDLLAEVLAGAAYPRPEVEADRGRTAEEMAIVLSRPEVLADEAFARRRFGRHPYAAGLPRPGDLLAVEAPALRRLHRRLLAPSRSHLVLVGDLQPKSALGRAEHALGPWLETGAAEAPAALPPIPPAPAGGIDLVDRPGAVQSNLRIGAAAPDRTAEEWPALSLANQIFGGMFTSRLVTNLRERNGYTYSPRSRIEHLRAGSVSTIGAEVATEATAAALVETRYELGRIATTGVTEEEVESARRYAVGSYLYQTATQSGLAGTLAGLAAAGIDPSYLATYPARLARVTAREVGEAARRWLAPCSMVTVVLGDSARIAGSLRSIDEVSTA
ncbi:MAG TPA: insulinase family protein [Acidimicrobiales bacterium]|nr:insulinase family protein [Acidimicrobiales bacterium]